MLGLDDHKNVIQVRIHLRMEVQLPQLSKKLYQARGQRRAEEPRAHWAALVQALLDPDLPHLATFVPIPVHCPAPIPSTRHPPQRTAYDSPQDS